MELTTDYDKEQDILFLKVKGRPYNKSIDFEHIIIDFDRNGAISGVQLFDASKLFTISKNTFSTITKWELTTTTQGNIITIHVAFDTPDKNRIFVERIHCTEPIKDEHIICAT